MISVTQALSIITQNYGPNEKAVELAAERGTRVHQACFAHALGLFPVMEEDTAGYLDSFKRWWDDRVADMGLSPETELRDERLGFCGHPDFPMLTLRDGRKIVLDIKTPAQYRRTWSLQMAAYWHLVRARADLEKLEPAVLMLAPDGKMPRLIWVEERERGSAAMLFGVFLNVLNIYRFVLHGKHHEFF